jgi:hypothetical protein
MIECDAATAAEAKTLGRYVIGKPIGELAVSLYAKATSMPAFTLDDRTARIRDVALRSPWLIAALDGALALSAPGNTFRKRILLMAAILETQPELANDFLPVDRPFWYAIVIGFVAVRAAIAAAIGLIVLRFVR